MKITALQLNTKYSTHDVRVYQTVEVDITLQKILELGLESLASTQDLFEGDEYDRRMAHRRRMRRRGLHTMREPDFFMEEFHRLGIPSTLSFFHKESGTNDTFVGIVQAQETATLASHLLEYWSEQGTQSKLSIKLNELRESGANPSYCARIVADFLKLHREKEIQEECQYPFLYNANGITECCPVRLSSPIGEVYCCKKRRERTHTFGSKSSLVLDSLGASVDVTDLLVAKNLYSPVVYVEGSTGRIRRFITWEHVPSELVEDFEERGSCLTRGQVVEALPQTCLRPVFVIQCMGSAEGQKSASSLPASLPPAVLVEPKDILDKSKLSELPVFRGPEAEAILSRTRRNRFLPGHPLNRYKDIRPEGSILVGVSA